MTAIVMDGRNTAKRLTDQYAKVVHKLNEENIFPKIVDISVGEDPAGKVYVRQKEKKANKIGIQFEKINLSDSITTEEFVSVIEEYNNHPEITGILVQRPLPEHLDAQLISSSISPNKDIDGTNASNIGHLVQGSERFMPCTPRAVLKLIDEYKVPMSRKSVAMIGKSQIVGLPMAIILSHTDVTVTLCHSKTQNIEALMKNSDVIIVAAGDPEFIKGNMIKQGAVVIDIGINQLEDGSIVGDCEYKSVSEVASMVTPVPGGVGPLTVMMLMEQTIVAACYQNNRLPEKYLGVESSHGIYTI